MLGTVTAMLVGLVAFSVSLWRRPNSSPMEPIVIASSSTQPTTAPNPTLSTAGPPEKVLEGVKGRVEVLIHRKTGTYGIGDKGALPLRVGDGLAFDLVLEGPAYCYLIYIDSTGKVAPLYPWKPGNWQSRPKLEQPITNLRVPERANGVFPVEPGDAGMETVALWTRSQPLPVDFDVQTKLGKLPAQTRQSPQSVIWLADGRAERPLSFDVKEAGDPVLVLHEALRTLKTREGGRIYAISFANLGRE
jgi:hypothetical protein